MTRPLVSVLIPARDAATTIGAAISSVRAQTFPDWEVVVVDDGSGDDTAAVVAAVVDPRVTLVSQNRRGVSAARNHAASIARGELLAFLDADDLFEAGKLERQVHLLAERPSVGSTYAAHRRVDEAGTPWTVHVPPAVLRPGDVLAGFPFNPSVQMVRRGWYERAGGFDEDLSENEDRDHCLRLLAAGCRFERTDGVLGDYRVRPLGSPEDAAGKLEQARSVLDRWRALDPPRAAEGLEIAEREYALRAAAAGDSATARSLLRAIVAGSPPLSDDRARRDDLLQAIVELAVRGRGNAARILDRVFREIAEVIPGLATERDAALASAGLVTATRELAWGQPAVAAKRFREALAAGARLDERSARLIRHQCREIRMAYGEERWRGLARGARRSARGGRIAARGRCLRRLLYPASGWASTPAPLRLAARPGPAMRIAFLVNRFPLLSETFVLNQVTGLVDRGHAVTIFARAAEPQPKVHGAVGRYGLSAVDLHQDEIRDEERLGLWVRTLATLVSAAARRPRLLTHCRRLLRYGSVRPALVEAHPVAALLRHGPFDVVHAHYGLNGVFATRLRRAGATDAKIVTTFHDGFDLSVHLRRHGVDAYREVFEQGDLLLAVSEAVASRLVALGASPTKLLVHRAGVDLGEIPARAHPARKDGAVTILSVARLVEMKGIEYGLRAVAELSRTLPGLRYEIVGDGPLCARLRARAEELGVGSIVRFLGWLDQAEVAERLAGADVFLAPSVTDAEGAQEGIPVAIMEAMASGLPVVATGYSGIPELVRDGSDGLLVPERDVTRLQAALRALVESPQERRRLGASARARVAALHDVAALNDELVRRYRRLVGRDDA